MLPCLLSGVFTSALSSLGRPNIPHLLTRGKTGHLHHQQNDFFSITLPLSRNFINLWVVFVDMHVKLFSSAQNISFNNQALTVPVLGTYTEFPQTWIKGPTSKGGIRGSWRLTAQKWRYCTFKVTIS